MFSKEELKRLDTKYFAVIAADEYDVTVMSRNTGHVLYNCSAARPNIESSTNEEEIEVQTETLAITAAPLANGYVKARTGDSTTDTVYAGWYSSVYMPTVEEDDPQTQPSGQQELVDDVTGGETL